MAMAKKTKKLNLLVWPTDPSYVYTMNAGTGIVTNPAAIRPAGSTVVATFLIFPGGTVSKHQADFSLDRNGKAINPNNNIGIAYLVEDMISTFDPATPPASTTRLAEFRLDIRFKKSCDGDDYVFSLGQHIAGTLPAEVGVAVGKMVAAVAGGTGCNQYQIGNGFVAHAFQSTTGAVPTLIQVEFANDVEYRS